MRIRSISPCLAFALALTACGGSDLGATTTSAAITTTTSQPPTTTSLPASTTSAAPSTTANLFPFLVDPSEADRESYALFALLSLRETAFSPDEIGNQEFVEMLVYGAQEACVEYNGRGELAAAISGALSYSPVSSSPIEDWTAEENTAAFSTMLAVMTSGMPIYCPSVAPAFPSDTSLAAEELASAWQEYIGGEPIDTEGWIRDGTWQVGVDIEPGTYRNGGSEGCYWERLSGFSGDSSDRVANGFPDGDPAIVTIQPTDAGFHSEECGRWTPAD